MRNLPLVKLKTLSSKDKLTWRYKMLALLYACCINNSFPEMTILYDYPNTLKISVYLAADLLVAPSVLLPA